MLGVGTVNGDGADDRSEDGDGPSDGDRTGDRDEVGHRVGDGDGDEVGDRADDRESGGRTDGGGAEGDDVARARRRNDQLQVGRELLADLGAAGIEEVVRDGAALLLRRGEVLLRIRPAAGAEVARREIAVARRLMGAGVPVTPLLEESVVERAGLFITVWRWVEAGRMAVAEDLGALARAIRERCGAENADSLPRFDPLNHVRDLVAGVSTAGAGWIRMRAAELEAPFEEATAADPLGSTIVHGDLHAGNVVVGREGPMLTDLEMAGWGPASHDAAPAVMDVRRYGASEETLRRFLDAFGADPTGDRHFETHVWIQELWVTAWAVAVADRRAEWATEAERRIATLRDGADSVWRRR